VAEQRVGKDARHVVIRFKTDAKMGLAPNAALAFGVDMPVKNLFGKWQFVRAVDRKRWEAFQAGK
jgi:hypothetical protein